MNRVARAMQGGCLALAFATIGCLSVDRIQDRSYDISQPELVRIAKGEVWYADTPRAYAAIERIESQSDLYDVARNSKYGNLCKKATERLVDQDLLEKLALEDMTVWEVAIARITDAQRLEKMFYNAKVDYNKRRRIIASIKDDAVLMQLYRAMAPAKEIEPTINMLLEQLQEDNQDADKKSINAKLSRLVQLRSKANDAEKHTFRSDIILALKNQDIIREIALTDKDSMLSSLAIDRLTNKELGATIKEIYRLLQEVEEDADKARVKSALSRLEELRTDARVVNNAEIRDFLEPRAQFAFDRAIMEYAGKDDDVAFVACKGTTNQTRIVYAAKTLRRISLLERAKVFDMINDQNALAELAVTPYDAECRQLAIDRLTDQEILADVTIKLLNSGHIKMSDVAAKRLTGSPKHIEMALNCNNHNVRRWVIEKINDQKTLLEIVLNNRYTDTVIEAIKKLNGTAVEGESEERIFSIVMEIIDKSKKDRPKREPYAFSITAEFLARTSDVKRKGEITAFLMKEIKEDICIDEQRKILMANLKEAVGQEAFEVALLENKDGWQLGLPLVDPACALRLFSSGKIRNATFESELAKIVNEDDITQELFESAISDMAQNQLLERMPTAVKESVMAVVEARAKELIAKAEANGKDTFSLKGFYLGMPIGDARELVRYYLPNSIVTITKKNNMEINVEHTVDYDVTPMYFCRADKDGKVYLINFDKRFLRKWFKYDVQTYREWAAKFGEEFNCSFRSKPTKGSYRSGEVVIDVIQECYQFRNNMKNFIVSYFGEKDVSDFNGGTDFNLFDTSPAGQWRAERAGRIARGRAWLKNDWDNGDGAQEGTLRVRILKDDE